VKEYKETDQYREYLSEYSFFDPSFAYEIHPSETKVEKRRWTRMRGTEHEQNPEASDYSYLNLAKMTNLKRVGIHVHICVNILSYTKIYTTVSLVNLPTLLFIIKFHTILPRNSCLTHNHKSVLTSFKNIYL
jgi:hypothetical protein